MTEKMTAEQLLSIATEASANIGEKFLDIYADNFRKFLTACKQAEDAGVDKDLIRSAGLAFGNGMATFDDRMDALMDRISEETGFALKL